MSLTFCQSHLLCHLIYSPCWRLNQLLYTQSGHRKVKRRFSVILSTEYRQFGRIRPNALSIKVAIHSSCANINITASNGACSELALKVLCNVLLLFPPKQEDRVQHIKQLITLFKIANSALFISQLAQSR